MANARQFMAARTAAWGGVTTCQELIMENNAYIELPWRFDQDSGFEVRGKLIRSEPTATLGNAQFKIVSREGYLVKDMTLFWVVNDNRRLFMTYGDQDGRTIDQYHGQGIPFTAKRNGRYWEFQQDGYAKVSQTQAARTFVGGSNIEIGNGGRGSNSSSSMYWCKLYDRGVLRNDLVPALDASGVPCVYCKVERKCYYNQGDGWFEAVR